MDTSAKAVLDSVQKLSDQLTKSSDLESSLDLALEFVLESVGRQQGALVVHTFSDPSPVFIVSRNLSPQWEAQLNDKTSDLREIALSVQKQGAELFGAEQVGAEQVELAAALPLCVNSSSQGTLLLQGGALSEDEIDLLGHLTRVVGRRIFQDHLEREADHPNEELAAILMTSSLTNQGMKPNQLQTRLMRSIYRFFQVEQGALVLLDKHDRELAIVKSMQKDAQWNYQVHLKQQSSLISQSIMSGELVLVNDVQNNPAFNPEVDGIQGTEVETFLCCPLEMEGEVQGALVLYNKRGGYFDGYDQKLIQTLSKLISYILYDLELVQRLQIASAELEVSRWQLLQSRNTLRAIFDNIPLAMYIIDHNYYLEAVNLSRAELADKSPAELVGQKCFHAFYDRDEPCSFCLVEMTLHQGGDTRQTFQRDGEEYLPETWEMTTYPNLTEDGRVRQAIIIEENITEKKYLEEQLIQSEKLAVAGQLAAGIAHEINNPLTAIVANSQLLRRSVEDEEVLEALELIEIAGARATDVVENLLNLARKDQTEFELADINELIEDSLDLVQHELTAYNIDLVYKPGEELPLLNVSKESLKGVWTNLILNAIDEQKGAGAGYIEITTAFDEKYIYVTVEDRGSGIPEEHLSRIFEPFFTTKGMGEGTGLGLAISQRVVKEHGGNIRVESELGEGAVFTVQLPYVY